MKKLILALALLSINSVALADQTVGSSIDDIDGIQFIRDYMPGTYDYIFSEWRRTNINNIVSIQAYDQSRANTVFIDNLEHELDTAIDDLNAGIAGAMAAASLPVANKGSDSFMVGAGIYNGQAAIAVGISGNTVDGKILKFSFTADTAGNSGGSAGASFEF